MPHQRRVAQQRQRFVAELLDVEGARHLIPRQLLDDGSGHRLWREVGDLREQLGDGGDDPAAGGGLMGGALGQVEERVDHGAWAERGEVAELADDPGDDLDLQVGEVLVVVERVEEGLDGVEAQIVVVLDGLGGVLTRPFGEEGQQVEGDLAGHEVSREEEHGVHGVDVPLRGGGVLLGVLAGALHQLLAEVRVRGAAQVLEALGGDQLDVGGVGHLVQQVQRRPAQRVVAVLQAAEHDGLVLCGVARVDAHDEDQRVEPQVLEVVVLVRQEARHAGRGGVQQRGVGVDAGDGADALVHHREPRVDPGVGALHALVDHLVHVLGGALVVVAEVREHVEDADLQPGRRDAPVLVGGGQGALADLLQDGHERRDGLAVAARGRGLDEVVVEAERRGHDAGVGVVEALLEARLDLGEDAGLDLPEAVQDQHGLLADHLVGVVDELGDEILHGGDGVGVEEADHGRQGGADLDEVGGGEVAPPVVDQQQHVLVIGVEEQGAGQVANALADGVAVGRHVDAGDVPEGTDVVSKHLAVKQSNQTLFQSSLLTRCFGICQECS